MVRKNEKTCKFRLPVLSIIYCLATYKREFEAVIPKRTSRAWGRMANGCTLTKRGRNGTLVTEMIETNIKCLFQSEFRRRNIGERGGVVAKMGEKYTFSQRRDYICTCLIGQEFVPIAQLTAALEVSEMTVRRDLRRLEEEGNLIRVHGGARRLPPQKRELPQNRRMLENRQAKERIGAYASRFVEDGDIILLDASTTTRYMVQHLLTRRITVITNQVDVAMGFSESKTAQVILLGGKLRKSSGSLTGYEVVEQVRRYNADKLFCSSKALDEAHGLTDVTVEEGEVKRAFLHASAERYLLMDSSKLDTQAFYQVAPIQAIHHLITDPPCEEHQAFLERCRSHQIQIHLGAQESGQ